MSTVTSTDVIELIQLVDVGGEVDTALVASRLVASRLAALVDTRANCGSVLIGIASAIGHMMRDHKLIPAIPQGGFYAIRVEGDSPEAHTAAGVMQITNALLNEDDSMANDLVIAALADDERVAELLAGALALFRRLHRAAHNKGD